MVYQPKPSPVIKRPQDLDNAVAAFQADLARASEELDRTVNRVSAPATAWLRVVYPPAQDILDHIASYTPPVVIPPVIIPPPYIPEGETELFYPDPIQPPATQDPVVVYPRSEDYQISISGHVAEVNWEFVWDADSTAEGVALLIKEFYASALAGEFDVTLDPNDGTKINLTAVNAGSAWNETSLLVGSKLLGRGIEMSSFSGGVDAGLKEQQAAVAAAGNSIFDSLDTILGIGGLDHKTAADKLGVITPSMSDTEVERKLTEAGIPIYNGRIIPTDDLFRFSGLCGLIRLVGLARAKELLQDPVNNPILVSIDMAGTTVTRPNFNNVVGINANPRTVDAAACLVFHRDVIDASPANNMRLRAMGLMDTEVTAILTSGVVTTVNSVQYVTMMIPKSSALDEAIAAGHSEDYVSEVAERNINNWNYAATEEDKVVALTAVMDYASSQMMSADLKAAFNQFLQKHNPLASLTDLCMQNAIDLVAISPKPLQTVISLVKSIFDQVKGMVRIVQGFISSLTGMVNSAQALVASLLGDFPGSTLQCLLGLKIDFNVPIIKIQLELTQFAVVALAEAATVMMTTVTTALAPVYAVLGMADNLFNGLLDRTLLSGSLGAKIDCLKPIVFDFVLPNWADELFTCMKNQIGNVRNVVDSLNESMSGIGGALSALGSGNTTVNVNVTAGGFTMDTSSVTGILNSLGNAL